MSTVLPPPLRANSDWASSWTGVLTVSDWPSRGVTIPWPDGLYASGRVPVVQHLIGDCPLLTACIYGFSPGGTYPQAAALTDALLQSLTWEIVWAVRAPGSQWATSITSRLHRTKRRFGSSKGHLQRHHDTQHGVAES